jgi:hypothetical protein
VDPASLVTLVDSLLRMKRRGDAARET